MATYFETKEHYLAFRASWARAVNDDRRFPTLVPCDEWIKEAGHRGYMGFGAVSEGTGRERVPGWVTDAHHALYNTLRNRPTETGFSPVTKTIRLQNGAYINHGLWWAVTVLIDHITTAKQYNTLLKKIEEFKETRPSFTRYNEKRIKRLEQFLEPFDGTVTIEMLASMLVPPVQPIESNFGKGMKLAKAIIEANRKPVTYEDMWNMYQEVK